MDMEKNGGARGLRTLALLVTVTLICGLIYLCGAALHLFRHDAAGDPERFAVTREGASLERSIAGETGSISQLRQMAGFPLPFLSGQTFLGEASNADYEGGNARVITMRYAVGITVSAVSPADAAPLLRRSGFSLRMGTGETLRIQGLRQQAVVTENGKASCVYFTTDDAAYAIEAPGLSGEQLVHILNEYGLSVQ